MSEFEDRFPERWQTLGPSIERLIADGLALGVVMIPNEVRLTLPEHIRAFCDDFRQEGCPTLPIEEVEKYLLLCEPGAEAFDWEEEPRPQGPSWMQLAQQLVNQGQYNQTQQLVNQGQYNQAQQELGYHGQSPGQLAQSYQGQAQYLGQQPYFSQAFDKALDEAMRKLIEGK
jgi:hypothetical protein